MDAGRERFWPFHQQQNHHLQPQQLHTQLEKQQIPPLASAASGLRFVAALRRHANTAGTCRG